MKADPAGELPEPVFSHGPWLFEETGQRFTGAELNAEAFTKYRGQMQKVIDECNSLREQVKNLGKAYDQLYTEATANDAILRQQLAEARAVPEGYVLAPKEPTLDMLRAAHELDSDTEVSWGATRADLYRAMKDST